MGVIVWGDQMRHNVRPCRGFQAWFSRSLFISGSLPQKKRKPAQLWLKRCALPGRASRAAWVGNTSRFCLHHQLSARCQKQNSSFKTRGELFHILLSSRTQSSNLMNAEMSCVLTAACVPHKPTRQQENKLHLLCFSGGTLRFASNKLFMWMPLICLGTTYILEEWVWNQPASTLPSISTLVALTSWAVNSRRRGKKRSIERVTHVSAGVRLMTSMTYAPEVTSGKSDCRSFSSFASLSEETRRKTAQTWGSVLNVHTTPVWF